MTSAAGCGWAVLPRLLGDRHPGLVRADFDADPPPGRDVFVGYHRDLRGLARLRAFLELTIDRLGAEAAPAELPAAP